MAIALDAPVVPVIDQRLAQQLAKQQITHLLGETYTVGKGQQLPNGDWHFLVQFHSAELARPLTCATIQINSQQGIVRPFTKAQLQEAQERVQLALQEARGEKRAAYEPLTQVAARRAANRYLSDQVGFFFTAIDGILIPVAPPVWQFLIQFRLPQSGPIGIFGTLDVDAQSDVVIPLSHGQIVTIQGRANAIARSQTYPTAA